MTLVTLPHKGITSGGEIVRKEFWWHLGRSEMDKNNTKPCLKRHLLKTAGG
jgi:hypothetical protein